MTKPNRTIEAHPIRHKWYKYHDVVISKNSRGRPVDVVRESHCEYCPTILKTRVDTLTWLPTNRSYYKYDKNTKIVRISKQEYARQQFLATTDLPEDIKRMLEAMRIQ